MKYKKEYLAADESMFHQLRGEDKTGYMPLSSWSQPVEASVCMTPFHVFDIPLE